MPPAQSYLVKYNGFVLPGYLQEETMSSVLNIGNHQSLFADASLSESLGLNNKDLSLRLKLWECSYSEAKEQAQLAATYLRTDRDSFSPLFIQRPDRYYEALTKNVSTQKEVGSSLNLREYTVDFEAKPWVTSSTINTLNGTGTVSTTGRQFTDGGWTPTTVTVTGTNVTISGYTDLGSYTGFMSINGSVTNMVVNSNTMSSTIGGVNANDKMLWADYSLYVGPGVTNFQINGASSCSIAYQNRWYI